MGQPHDKLFKAVFGDARKTRPWLQALLPPDLVAALDLTALRPIPGSFMDNAFRAHHTDLIFQARAGPRDVLLYILFEHQSQEDARMAERLLRYIINAWHDPTLRGPSIAPPLMLPIVLFHGTRPWGAPRTLQQQLQHDGPLPQALLPFLPSLDFVLIDLGEHPDDTLRKLAIEGAALGGLALLLMKHMRSPDLADRLLEWGGLALRALTEPQGLRGFAHLVRYILENRTDVDVRRLEVMIENHEQGVKVIGTTADRLRAEGESKGLARGLARGLERGLERGLAEGRARGQADGLGVALLRILEQRFGEIDSAIRERIKNASASELERWVDRALVATSPAEVVNKPIS